MTRFAALLAALGIALASRAVAQGAPLARARTALAAGDSASALAQLDRAIRSDARAAPAWHLRGLVAWGLSKAHRRDGLPQSRRYIELASIADSSLRLAAQYAPDSARYALDLGRFLMASTHATVRSAATDVFTKAMKAATRSGDSLLLSRAADKAGEGHWRRYEPLAHRRNLAHGFAFVDLDRYITEPRDLENYLDNFTIKLRPPLGEADYHRAVELFQAALAADPNSAGALKHLFMAFADRERWREMRETAEWRLALAPWDPWAWMARGLASHRLNDPRDAVTAFDSALAFFSPEHRSSYTRFSRLLRPADTARIGRMSSEERARTERMYWLASDPLTLTTSNEHSLEFLSRVAFAELRWSSEDFNQRGADTDRGEVYIRYGPAPFVMTLPPGPDTFVPVIWRYANGLSFQFSLRPSTGEAPFSFEMREVYARQLAALPAAWRNVPIDRRIDSLSVQAVRFRAPGDSVDVVFHASLPIARLTRGLPGASVAMDLGLFVFDGGARFIVRDSTREEMSLAGAESTVVRTWRHRLRRGTLGYRVEALQPDSMRGARAFGILDSAAEPPFGTSDLLIAERLMPREGFAPLRWTDMLITPSAGVLKRGQQFALMWETYGLTATAKGSHEYSIDMTLRRTDGSGLSAFLGRILGGTTSGAEARAGQKGEGLRLSFMRNVAARPEVLDYLTLDLSDAPPGKYRITITVTDVPARKNVTTERDLTIVP